MQISPNTLFHQTNFHGLNPQPFTKIVGKGSIFNMSSKSKANPKP